MSFAPRGRSASESDQQRGVVGDVIWLVVGPATSSELLSLCAFLPCLKLDVISIFMVALGGISNRGADTT